jgi:hypothetical protein
VGFVVLLNVLIRIVICGARKRAVEILSERSTLSFWQQNFISNRLLQNSFKSF